MSRDRVFVDEKEAVKFLTNDLVICIFVTLCTEPMNTRGLSRILSVYESIISKKLKAMDKLGLVTSKWVRIKGKNVKLYYPRTDSYSIRVGVHSVEIVYGSRELGVPKQYKAPSTEKIFVGREKELEFLRDCSRRFVFVVGLPGIGKTSLVSKCAGESGYQVVWIGILETTTLQGIVRSIAFTLEGVERKNLINAIKNGYGDISTYIDLVIDLVKKNKVLLVLDNYHLNADPGIELLVKKLALLENLQWIIDNLDKISYYRQIHTLLATIPIACSNKATKTLCKKAEEKLTKTIKTQTQKTIQKITEKLTSNPNLQ